ncbi:hypothetical protein [Erythrobacter sp.]|jgi:hypothetical protein|uniref:hypothetical protein n=1 Tax=Erythrobacter sp. TaxID=1042 RepID=UPI002EA6DB58|nr:hypothetical protein [Erythrobacter sp.]
MVARPAPILAVVALTAFSLTLPGCLLRTAADVVTAPIRIGSKAIDLATTSQSEADEKRGREIRRREERLAKLERRYREELEDCEDGDRGACVDARATYAEIEELLPTIPVEPPED